MNPTVNLAAATIHWDVDGNMVVAGAYGFRLIANDAQTDDFGHVTFVLDDMSGDFSNSTFVQLSMINPEGTPIDYGVANRIDSVEAYLLPPQTGLIDTNGKKALKVAGRRHGQNGGVVPYRVPFCLVITEAIRIGRT